MYTLHAAFRSDGNQHSGLMVGCVIAFPLPRFAEDFSHDCYFCDRSVATGQEIETLKTHSDGNHAFRVFKVLLWHLSDDG